MARLTEMRTVKWAGVEFQPNLLQPIKRPIRLGALLWEVRGQSTAIAVIGRMPRLESRPPGFENVGDITINIASRWVDAMFKDATAIDGADLFEEIAHRWRYNLYLRNAQSTREARGSIETVAKQLYARFVGVPFKGPTPPKAPKPSKPSIILPTDLPPAWQLEQIDRLQLGASRFG